MKRYKTDDPEPHDHVLIANVVEMLDGQGGYKALDTALIRDQLHAATMVGRVAAARKAVELGYAIEADDGRSGKLGHWRIVGILEELCVAFSKRAAEIDAAVSAKGYVSLRARGVAARDTRRAAERRRLHLPGPRFWYGGPKSRLDPRRYRALQ